MLALIAVSGVLAQGDVIGTLTNNGYKIDYSVSPGNITANTPILFIFSLKDEARGIPASYSYAQVSIRNSSEILQIAKLFNDGGVSSMKTILPYGNYNVNVSFYNSNTLISGGSFNIESGSTETYGYVESILYLLLIIFGISIALLLYLRYTRKKYDEEILIEFEREESL